MQNAGHKTDGLARHHASDGVSRLLSFSVTLVCLSQTQPLVRTGHKAAVDVTDARPRIT